MVIYYPTEIKVELTERETETIQNCREVINDIVESLTKTNCAMLDTEEILISKANLQDMSRRLELLLKIKSMY